MKILFVIVIALILSGCTANGVSKYEYEHYADGSTKVKVKSVNEIGSMNMGINRETGTLEVTIEGVTKKSDTAEVVGSIKEIIHDVTTVGVPN